MGVGADGRPRDLRQTQEPKGSTMLRHLHTSFGPAARYTAWLYCILAGLCAHSTIAQGVVTYVGTHTGMINATAFQATTNGIVNGNTGSVMGTLTIAQPAGFNIAPSGLSYWCISCSNSFLFLGSPSVPNIAQIIGGAGTYSHNRTYTYPNHPGNVLTVAATFSLAGGVLTYSGNWNGTTNASNMPTDFVDVAGYAQLLTPAGPGLIAVSGQTNLVRANGLLVPIAWTGFYNLGPGNNLPTSVLGVIDLDFSPATGSTYNITGTTFGMRPCAIALSSSSGPGSLRIDNTPCSPAGGQSYITAITTAPGSFPNGWFLGLDISWASLISQANSGAPFSGTLNPAGASTFSVMNIPPGLTLYAVTAQWAPGLGLLTSSRPPVSHVIP